MRLSGGNKMNTKFLLKLYRIIGEIVANDVNIEFYSALRAIMKRVSTFIEYIEKDDRLHVYSIIRDYINLEINKENLYSKATPDFIREIVSTLNIENNPIRFKRYSISSRKQDESYFISDTYILIEDGADTDIYSFIDNGVISKVKFLGVLNDIALKINEISLDINSTDIDSIIASK